MFPSPIRSAPTILDKKYENVNIEELRTLFSLVNRNTYAHILTLSRSCLLSATPRLSAPKKRTYLCTLLFSLNYSNFSEQASRIYVTDVFLSLGLAFHNKSHTSGKGSFVFSSLSFSLSLSNPPVHCVSNFLLALERRMLGRSRPNLESTLC